MHCARSQRNGHRQWIGWVWAMMIIMAGWLSAAEPAALPSLKVGDPAPPFMPGRWLHGDALPELPRQKPAVVVFWTGDNMFARAALRRMDAQRERFKDKGITFVGVNVWNSENFAAQAVKSLAKEIALPLTGDAQDEKGQGKMAAAWLEAAGQEAAPVVFVMNHEARIAWIGHPYGLTEKLLNQICDRTFDLTQAIAVYAEALRKETQLATLIETMEEADANDNQVPQIMAALDRMEKLVHPDNRPGIGALRFKLLQEEGEFAAAAKLAVQLSESYPEEPWLQNLLAWDWATNDDFEKPDYDAIEKIARRANAAAYERDAAIMDTLARALFLKGKKDEAVKLQEKAVKMADPEMRGQLQDVLENYRRGIVPPAENH